MVVLDTHILIWWVTGSEQLPKKAKDTINSILDNNDNIIVSSISTWEIAMLIKKNRLVLSMDVESWIKNVSDIPNLIFCPVDNEIALKATLLPGEFHKDPADRIIVATARKYAIPVITSDQKILEYKHVKSIC